MASVFTRPPAERVLDPAALGQPEVAALADDPGAQLLAVHPDGVVRLVAHVEGALGRRLHVGADAAVEQQVDRRQQDRPDQLDRAESASTSSASPRAARIGSETGIDFAVRGHTPPPALIRERL